MEILLKGWSWLIESKIYIAVLLFVVIFIIGWLFSMLEKSFTKKLKDEDDLEKFKLYKAVNNASQEQLERVIEELPIKDIKTINIYYEGAIHINQHNLMIRKLQTHLEMEGFKESLGEAEALALPRWDCPVLIIVPSANIYTFHEDQQERRENTNAFTINTNSSVDLARRIDIEIKRMRGDKND
jgi:hypothetical protein